MSEQKQKGITRETLKFVFKTAWKERPSVFLVYLMKFISEFASKMQNAIMAKLIIDELVLMITGAEFAQHLANAAIFAGLYIVIQLLTGVLGSAATQLESVHQEWFSEYVDIQLADRTMKMDFEHTEDPEALDALEKAQEGMSWYSGGIVGVLGAVFGLVNNAAALLSDENRFYGIDMARFGSSINEIMDRETFSHMSILKQYDAAVNMIKRYYQYEEINEIERKKVDLIPETAYREAIANALVHRDWSIPAHIRILMFKDRIEIKSPGGLPKGITADEYLNGEISCLRNPILGNLFFRLQYIEMFGTGIRRIQYSYRNALIKPKFEVTDNVISVVLPVLNSQYQVTSDERKIINELGQGGQLSSSEIAKRTGMKKSKTLRLIEHLKEKGYVRVTGNGRGTKYTL